MARADLFSDRAAGHPGALTTHSLPLAQYLGDANSGQLAGHRDGLARIEKSPALATVSRIGAGFPPNGHAGQFDEVQFLRICQRGLPGAVWSQPANVSRALNVLGQGQRAAVPDDERAQYWSIPLVAAGNRARRQADDQMFVGDEAALTAAAPLWDEASRHYAQAEKLTQAVTNALTLGDQTSAEIPYLARSGFVAYAAWPDNRLPAADGEINDTLLKLIHAAAQLNATLAGGQPGDAATGEMPAFEEEAREVRRQFEHLQNLYSKECRQLEELKKGDAAAVRRLEAVLAAPLIPARQREELRKLAAQFAAQFNSGCGGWGQRRETGEGTGSGRLP